MKYLIDLVLARPRGVVMIWIALTLFGAAAATQLRIEHLPWIEVPEAHVVAEFGGLPASRMEDFVTIPLENALASIRAVQEIEAITQAGVAVVRLRLRWGASLDAAAVDIRAAIDTLYPSLPEGVERPALFLGERLAQPLAVLAIYPAGGRSFENLDRIITHDLRPALRRIAGIGRIQVVGTQIAEIVVAADAERLRSASVTLADLAGAVQAALPDQTVGVVTDRGRERQVRVNGGIDSLAAVAAIPIVAGTDRKRDIRVGEMAAIGWDTKPRTSLFRVDGRDAVGVYIYKRPGVGSINAAGELRRSLPELQHRFADRLQIVELGDKNEIIASFGALGVTLLLGIVATVLVLWLTLGSGRAAWLVVPIIPISIGGCLLCMAIARVSLNTVSLAGLVVGIGMIVDNGILVVDNLARRRARSPQQIAAATLEIISAAAGGTLTTLLVFIPLLLLPGISGALFRELALVVIFALTFSFVAAATLIPALYLRAPLAIRSVRWLRTAERIYGRYLLRARRPVVAGGLALFVVIGLAAWLAIPKTLATSEESRHIEGQVYLRRDLTAEVIRQQVEVIEAELTAVAEIGALVIHSGHHPDALRDRALPDRHISTLNLEITLSPHPAAELARIRSHIETRLTAAIGDDWLLGSPRNSVEQLLDLRQTPLYRLTGRDRSALLREAERLRDAIFAQDAARAVIADTRADNSRYRLHLHHEATSYYGFDTRAALAQLRVAVRGTLVGALKIDSREVDLRVRMAERYSADPDAIGRLRVTTNRGHIELADLGELRREDDYNALYRWNRTPAVTLALAPAPNAAQTRRHQTRRLPAHGRPHLQALLANYRPQAQQVDGTLVGSSSLAGHYRQLGLLFVLASALIFLMLGAQLDSARRSLQALFMLIPALAGSAILLVAGGKSLDLHAALGILILLGVCVNAAILPIETYRRGESRHIIARSILRLRPTLATLLTTIVALVPIALANQREAATAIAVIGGMSAGTLAALLLIPILYLHPQRHSEQRSKQRSGQQSKRTRNWGTGGYRE